MSAVSTPLARSLVGRKERPAVRYPEPHADVAQLVEHQLPKLRVAGSNPVVRFLRLHRCFSSAAGGGGAARTA